MTAREFTGQLDALLSRERFSEAEEYILSVAEDAEKRSDEALLLTVQNEYMGFARQYLSEEKALNAAHAALDLLKRLDLENSQTAGTVFLNAATVHQRCKLTQTALPLYKKAQELYNRYLSPSDERFAGLYNNMASCYVTMGDYATAEYYYTRAFRLLSRTDNICDMAVTCFNLAQMHQQRDIFSAEIEEYVSRGVLLMRNATQKNSYYYYTCRKCAASCAYLGYVLYEKEFTTLADEYAKRN